MEFYLFKHFTFFGCVLLKSQPSIFCVLFLIFQMDFKFFWFVICFCICMSYSYVTAERFVNCFTTELPSIDRITDLKNVQVHRLHIPIVK